MPRVSPETFLPPHASPHPKGPPPQPFCLPCFLFPYFADAAGPLTWIDPGAFALVGAGAFMGGVTRLTVALAVIMIEVSSDVRMLLPVLVAIMTVRRRFGDGKGVVSWTGLVAFFTVRRREVGGCAHAAADAGGHHDGETHGEG